MKRQLQRLFDQLNRQYFGGKLPHYRIVVVRSLPEHSRCDGRCFVRWKIIAINANILEGREEEVLAHECIHAYLGCGGHGRRFNAVVEKMLQAQGPIRPALRYRTPWLKEFPFCDAWARKTGLKSRKTVIKHALRQFISTAACDLGIHDFRSAIRQAAFDVGIPGKSACKYLSWDGMRKAFNEGMECVNIHNELVPGTQPAVDLTEDIPF